MVKVNLTHEQLEAIQILLDAHGDRGELPPPDVCNDAYHSIKNQTGITGRGIFYREWTKEIIPKKKRWKGVTLR